MKNILQKISLALGRILMVCGIVPVTLGLWELVIDHNSKGPLILGIFS